MKFEFNEKEVLALKELIHIAVKSAGMQAAETGVILTKKLSSPLKEEVCSGPKEKKPASS